MFNLALSWRLSIGRSPAQTFDLARVAAALAPVFGRNGQRAAIPRRRDERVAVVRFNPGLSSETGTFVCANVPGTALMK